MDDVALDALGEYLRHILRGFSLVSVYVSLADSTHPEFAAGVEICDYTRRPRLRHTEKLVPVDVLATEVPLSDGVNLAVAYAAMLPTTHNLY